MQRGKYFLNLNLYGRFMSIKQTEKNYQKIPATITLKQCLKIAIYVALYGLSAPYNIACDVYATDEPVLAITMQIYMYRRKLPIINPIDKASA